MTTKIDELTKAREAAAELTRLEGLRDRLPELEAEIEREARQAEAGTRLTVARSLARTQAQRRRDAMADWRRRFAEAADLVDKLVEDLRAIEEPSRLTALDLVRSVHSAAAIGVPVDHAAGEWVAAGWGDRAMAAFPEAIESERARALAGLVARLAGGTYDPGKGIRNYTSV